ncbi:MAG: iron ABC transporter permease [Oscillospiraceae bacterium]|nr:iron ABC transporter permease [Oscillospiraceae bacterium]
MKTKIFITISAALVILVLGVSLGSVNIPPGDVLGIIGHEVLGLRLPPDIKPATVTILWNLRLPRVLLAFIAGGALSVSGAVMQSLLRNPLASSYTIGVSSGASLGASFVILYGAAIPIIGAFALPFMGFIFGLGTILIAIALASRLDKSMENNTIILVGMVFSLFVNAITTLMAALSKEQMQRLITWQMGSFSMKDWQAVYILAPVLLLGTAFIAHFDKELDMMTFGEDQAKTMGVNLKSVKWTLLVSSAAITGSTIAFVGVIGFVDLVAPHIVRKLFGSSHRLVIPMSAVLGGAFMVVCDLAARTVVSPSELPVGAVTALIGAPFFAYIYFSRRASRGVGRRAKKR